MDYNGFNMSSIKTANRAGVLYLLNSGEPLSRKDIAQKLGLTPAAVSKICAELICEGAICESGISDSNGVGRKKIILMLNSKAFFTLALSIDKKGFYCALCTLDGEEKTGSRFEFELPDEPESCLVFVGKKAREMIEKSKIEKEKIIGVGVGIVGGVDTQSGKTAGHYGFWKPGVCVREILEKELLLPVAVENNVKAFALASLIFESPTESNILFVKWGPGVGSAIVINGTVLGKADSDSSEIGHYIAQPNGRLCRCKRHGCLETLICADSILSKVKSSFEKERMPKLFELVGGKKENISIEKILLASKSDSEIFSLLEKDTRLLAKAVTNAATVIAPDRIIVFGYMFDERIFSLFKNECTALYPEICESFIRLSPLDKKHNFIGPAAVAAKSFFFEKSDR